MNLYASLVQSHVHSLRALVVHCSPAVLQPHCRQSVCFNCCSTWAPKHQYHCITAPLDGLQRPSTDCVARCQPSSPLCQRHACVVSRPFRRAESPPPSCPSATPSWQLHSRRHLESAASPRRRSAVSLAAPVERARLFC